MKAGVCELIWELADGCSLVMQVIFTMSKKINMPFLPEYLEKSDL